ncbi:hypothetical protein DENSPDRAFT_884310 [Dentipellis sp. KUC8613]|nr:hypothetical protein DENSPDRAFT_884310 [Dentipellis sp. KUC8613]
MAVISNWDETKKASIRPEKICLTMVWPKIFGDSKNDWALSFPPVDSSRTAPPMDRQKSSSSTLAQDSKSPTASCQVSRETLAQSNVTSEHSEDPSSTFMQPIAEKFLSHSQSPDIKEVWQVLENSTSSFTRSLVLRRRFLMAKKMAAQTMEAWVGHIEAQVREMEAIGIAISEQDKIIALTMGLPSAYAHVILAFDAGPDQLTFNNIVIRLLDKGTRL